MLEPRARVLERAADVLEDLPGLPRRVARATMRPSGPVAVVPATHTSDPTRTARE